jgi:hypothetical protein
MWLDTKEGVGWWEVGICVGASERKVDGSVGRSWRKEMGQVGVGRIPLFEWIFRS